jgi:hypothetical protein
MREVTGESDESLLAEMKAAYKSTTLQRTSLKRWMTENSEGFTEKLNEMFPNGRVNWVWLTEWFQEKGFRNRDGSDLKRETVQKVWRRVLDAKSQAGG